MESLKCLSDGELKQKMKDCGLNLVPIENSTRDVIIKMIAAKMKPITGTRRKPFTCNTPDDSHSDHSLSDIQDEVEQEVRPTRSSLKSSNIKKPSVSAAVTPNSRGAAILAASLSNNNNIVDKRKETSSRLKLNTSKGMSPGVSSASSYVSVNNIIPGICKNTKRENIKKSRHSYAGPTVNVKSHTSGYGDNDTYTVDLESTEVCIGKLGQAELRANTRKSLPNEYSPFFASILHKLHRISPEIQKSNKSTGTKFNLGKSSVAMKKKPIKGYNEWDTGSDTEPEISCSDDYREHHFKSQNVGSNTGTKSDISSQSFSVVAVSFKKRIRSIIDWFRAKTQNWKEEGQSVNMSTPLKIPYLRDLSSVKGYNITPNGHFAPKFNKSAKVQPEDDDLWNWQFISGILQVFFMIFFVFVGYMYWITAAKEGSTTYKENKLNYTVCFGKPEESKNGNCIPKSALKSTGELFKYLHSELLQQKSEEMCGYSGVNATMSFEYAQVLLGRKLTLDALTFAESFECLKTLIADNPEWGLIFINETGSRVNRWAAWGVTCVNYNISLLCRLGLLIVKMIPYTAVAIVVFTLFHGIQWWVSFRAEGEKEVFQLVEQVIHMLKNNNVHKSDEPYLAINHVRDQLIPPLHRKQKAQLWEKVVHYLGENESRVREEIQLVAGEECRVWRWLPAVQLFNNLPPVKAPKPPSSGSKIWQGQAFEMKDGSVNPLPYSSTNCLKIRRMFDPDFEFGEKWPVRIQDAILEKACNCSIIHIGVDRTSSEGCVYVKCVSRDDARRAFESMHGWWFDGNLVTVKYLREERYNQRFPNASHASVPLHSTNSYPPSLLSSIPNGDNDDES